MRLILATVMTAALVSLETLAGQADEFTTLKWWHPVVAGTAITVLFAVDEPVSKFVQDNRSGTLDDVSDVAKRFKEPEVFYVAGGGAIAVGLLAGFPTVTRTGLQIFAAYGVSSGMMIATKWVFGRSRPSQTPNDAVNFDWFNGGSGSSFPSGSAAVVFSLATTVADAVDHPAASVLLYRGRHLEFLVPRERQSTLVNRCRPRRPLRDYCRQAGERSLACFWPPPAQGSGWTRRWHGYSVFGEVVTKRRRAVWW